MKTPWRKRYKYGINTQLFGKPGKKSRWLYGLLLLVMVLLGLLLEYI
ncbi:hypothetical protein ADICEAN_01235 [Cesiribacter andamanensis AMV16]|uniref:Uncharacterized protein n=2 Tax=Cesiribacter TaxID=1133570 RepID=M7N4P4_9BACT|nr:hypothetical protein ADICEAN_01235 [Cesiribacter andamanensis AMV16]